MSKSASRFCPTSFIFFARRGDFAPRITLSVSEGTLLQAKPERALTSCKNWLPSGLAGEMGATFSQLLSAGAGGPRKIVPSLTLRVIRSTKSSRRQKEYEG